MLELRALGALDLRVNDGPVEAVLDRPKAAALLAYLVLDQPGLFHHADSLSALFWPELDLDPARDALDGVLTFLRQELPDGILTTLENDYVGIALRDVRCDVYAFEDAVAAGRWADALDLYEGDLLAEAALPDVDGFGEWLVGERERLRELAARARSARDAT